MDPLKIGHVIAVRGDTVEVQITTPNLKLEYHGSEYRVGKLGSYVTIPVGKSTLVGYIVEVGAAGDLEPLPDPGAPRRVTMKVQLLGTVRNDKFQRGVSDYPTLSDDVRLGVDEDFELIFGSFEALTGGDRRRAFSMGKFAIDPDFEVKVLGKEFFAKHVAVMGNSGSGKSVTTAKIVYEALRMPHAHVVMFDMHGEYLSAFSDDQGRPNRNVTYLSDKNLVLPYWMLRFEEFEQLFVDMNNPGNVNAQLIFLRIAFERLKQFAARELSIGHELTIDTPVYYSLDQLKTFAQNMNDARYVLGSDSYAFSRLPFRSLPHDEQEKLMITQRMQFNAGNAEGEVPHSTFYGRLLGLINMLETRMDDRRYDFLLHPFDQAAKNPGLRSKIQSDMGPGELSQSVAAVIRQLLGYLDERKNLTIVDLSGLPFEMVDITVAVLTRTLFDFNFWSPVEKRLPVLLVYEEAHNYLFRGERPGKRTFARDAVEKVAKEGRKYGVSAMIVSQRPSEISETVLSQCNSMVLMRMNNPDDQEYAARVVSDQFRDLIDLLPAMRPGEGFIIGDSVMMPMRTLIDMPPRLPRSGDMDFFRLWGQGVGEPNTEQIIDRWWRQDRTASNKGTCELRASDGAAHAENSSGGASAGANPNAAHSSAAGGTGTSTPSPRTPASPAPGAPALTPAQQKLAELAALVNGKAL